MAPTPPSADDPLAQALERFSIQDAHESVRERLAGMQRQAEFETLCLDAVEHHYGSIGRSYLLTRLRLALIAEEALIDLASDCDVPDGQMGHS